MTTREPDRNEAKARELDRWIVRHYGVPESYTSVNEIAAALRQAADDALERAAHRLEEIARDYEGRKLRSLAMDETVEAPFLEQMGRATWRCVKAVYELKSPAAAPAAENWRAADPVDRFARDDDPPSKPVAPAPDWSVRAGDKCTRVGCDKRVVAFCLPHRFGGCEEHMREHDARCAYEQVALARAALADGGEAK